MQPAPALSSSAKALTWSFGVLAFAALSYTTADADLWGHLRFGLDLLKSHHLTAVDPYSFTQDRPWINHEWLSELQTAIAWTAAGPAGLALLKGALSFLVVVIGWTSAKGLRLSARAGALVVFAFGTVHVTSSLRPQVWTFASLAVLCRVLADEDWRKMRWLPLLFAFWANCHGGWIVGFAVLGVWASARCLEDFSRTPRWLWIVLSCLAATLINPYGWGLWRFLADTVRPSRGANILEWGPLFGTPVLNWLPWFVCVAGVIWAGVRGRRERWAIVGVLALLAYASFRVMRVESLFVEAAVILLAPALAARWPHSNRPLPVRSRADRAALVFLCAVPIVASAWLFTLTLRCVPNISLFKPDLLAARALENAESGRMVTYFNWGQYAIWHFGPRLLVSMDGRRETVYSDARLREADEIVLGSATGLAVLAAWKADYVWLPEECATTRHWLATHGYRIDVETADSFVAVRADHPTLHSPPSASSIGPRCFPD